MVYADLRYILEESEIDLGFQCDLVQLGIRSLPASTNLADTRADSGAVLKDDVGIDPAVNGVEDRVRATSSCLPGSPRTSFARRTTR